MRKGTLFYYENDYEDLLDPLGSIALKNVLVVANLPLDPEEPESKFGFSVLDGERMWDMYAADEAERAEWVSVLSSLVTKPRTPLQPRLVGGATFFNSLLKSWSNMWCLITDNSLVAFEKEAVMDRFAALAPANLDEAPAVLMKIATSTHSFDCCPPRVNVNIVQLRLFFLLANTHMQPGTLKLNPCTVKKVGMYEGRDFTMCISTAGGTQTFIAAESDLHVNYWIPALEAAAGEDAAARILHSQPRESVASLASDDGMKVEKTGHLIKKGGSVKVRQYLTYGL